MVSSDDDDDDDGGGGVYVFVRVVLWYCDAVVWQSFNIDSVD